MFRLVSGRLVCISRLSISQNAVSELSTLAESTDESHQKALPFNEIPEPRSLPLIGTALDYSPIRGFDAARVHELWHRRHEEYGNIFRERIFGPNYWVFCRTKEDTELQFRTEGRMPYRMALASITKFKTMMGYPESIVNLKGEPWLRLRQPINKLMLKTSMVWKYTDSQREICKEAVQYIMDHRDENHEIPEMADFLQAWAFEMASAFIFDTRFGVLKGNVPQEVSDAFYGFKRIMQLIGAGSAGGLSKLKARMGMKRVLDKTKKFLISTIERQKQAGFKEGTVFHGILDLKTLSEWEKESLLVDIMTASVETTSNALGLCLYCLATNSRVQEKLREEIMQLSSQERSSGRAIDGMVYMNAFLKEAHRQLPFTHFLARVYDHDITLSGYNIPAGTRIINLINSSFNKNPEYFENPDKCIPERWFDRNTSRFCTTGPFGIGGRACPGRVFARQEIVLFLLEILTHFEIQYHHEPATSVNRATGVLSREPKFSFIPIN